MIDVYHAHMLGIWSLFFVFAKYCLSFLYHLLALNQTHHQLHIYLLVLIIYSKTTKSAMEEEDRAINTSELGSRSFWDNLYGNELAEFQASGDEGECWFGVQLQKRIVDWLKRRVADSRLILSDCCLVDIGCGNGLMLLQLVKAGFRSLIGIDYSENAIQLARSVLDQDECVDARFVQLAPLDLLAEAAVGQFQQAFKREQVDCILDKGTYDAICLNPDTQYTLKEYQQRYCQFLMSMLRPGGLFLIASCNWTRDELLQQFVTCTPDQHSSASTSKPDCKTLQLMDEIEQPSFKFGGKIGKTVTCLIFEVKE